MPVALSVSLPLIMAVVLIASGVAKLRHPDDLAGWRELGVPAALQQRWLLRLHPWGEIVLGAAVALLGGVLGVLASLVAVALMAVYTILVARTLRRTPDASCACFGESAPVTRWTVVRNVWLTLVAVGSAVTVWATPLFGGAVASAVGSLWWVLSLVVAAVTVFVVMRRDAPETPAEASTPPLVSVAHAGDELDYVRTRTPAVPVTLADGTVVSLRRLTTTKPLLVLLVSEYCGSCQPVIESVDRYRELLPEVEVRFLLSGEPDQELSLASVVEPQTLHDPHHYVADSIVDNPATPTAILFGMDGLLAGGPEVGSNAIDAFVDDIYESLHGERPAR